MNEDTLNRGIRAFLKQVGVSSQRELEHAALKAETVGHLRGRDNIAVKMTLEAPELGLHHCIEGSIALD